MKRAARFIGLTTVAFSFLTSGVKAEVLAEYTFDAGANFNPNMQGWTLGEGTEEDVNFFISGPSLLIQESQGPPNTLFTHTVPTNVFFDAWSFTGTNRFAANTQEEFGMVMFVDDGTNIWHLSFFNTASPDHEGIYNGGDSDDPNWLANTATKIWKEPLDQPFDGFADYAIVDTDGAGGAAPQLYFDGAPVDPVVSLIPHPSKFAAGTIGWGSLNLGESGFFQTQHMVFDGNPDAVPPSLFGDYNGDLTVNAADYAVWRDGGSPDDSIAGYDLWRANFGDSGAGSGSAAVPEPQSLALLVISAIALIACRRAQR